MKERLNTTE